MKHLTEIIIQQLASGERLANSDEKDHLEACPQCQAELALAQLVITGVREQPKPVFDFNLGQAVLAQLEVKKVPTKRRFSPIIFMSIVFLVLGATIIYVFNDSFLSLIGVAKQMLLYALLIAVISIMCMVAVDMLHHYNRKMRMLESL